MYEAEQDQLAPAIAPVKKEKKIKRWEPFSLAIIWLMIFPFSFIPALFSFMAFSGGIPSGFKGALWTISVLLITTSPISILTFVIADIRFSFKPKIEPLSRWRVIFLCLQVLILIGVAWFTFWGFQDPTGEACQINEHGQKVNCHKI